MVLAICPRTLGLLEQRDFTCSRSAVLSTHAPSFSAWRASTASRMNS